MKSLAVRTTCVNAAAGLLCLQLGCAADPARTPMDRFPERDAAQSQRGGAGGGGGSAGAAGGNGGAQALPDASSTSGPEAGASLADAATKLDAMPSTAADGATVSSDASTSPVSTENPIAGVSPLAAVVGGFKKLDTPCWVPKDNYLVIAELDTNTHYKVVPPKTMTMLRQGASRCTTGPDGALYFGSPDKGLVKVGAGGEEVLLPKLPDGTAVSINDLVVTRKGMVFHSNLKAPEPPGKGSFNVFDTVAKQFSYVWDGRMEATLWNPNGVALSPDEKFLYVGISSYDSRSTSAVYRFPLSADGKVDVAAGKAQKWAPVQAPDGIAVDSAGNVYFTAGSAVQVYAADGKKWGTIAIPKGSGSNVGFGGPDMKTLYVTTFTDLYATQVKVPGLL